MGLERDVGRQENESCTANGKNGQFGRVRRGLGNGGGSSRDPGQAGAWTKICVEFFSKFGKFFAAQQKQLKSFLHLVKFDVEEELF